MENVLLDTYKETGKDSVLSGVAAIAARTHAVTFHPDEIQFLSLCRVSTVQEPGMAVFYALSRDNLIDFAEYGDSMRLVKTKISDIGTDYYQELVDTTGLMMYVNGEKYILSQASFLTLCQQALLGGDVTVNRSNIFRDMHLADAFFQKNDIFDFHYKQ